MVSPSLLEELARLHQLELRKAADDTRPIREARKAQYARSGPGHRFIPAGRPFFREHDDAPRAA
jgi:hypothetical protein